MSALSLYGVVVPETGQVTGFSVPFVVLNMIGGGLSYFIAVAWNNVFQSALDRYKQEEQSKGNVPNQIWLNFMLALVATLFTIAVMYLMIKSYTTITKNST